MDLTPVPDDEIPPHVRAEIAEMVEKNRDDIAKVRAALRIIDAAEAVESGPGEAAGPVTYAHAQVATVAAEGTM